MNLKRELRAHVDDQGRLELPPEVMSRDGLRRGSQVCLEEEVNGLRLFRPATHLAKVYIEPTNQCNLLCRMCVRNAWDEPLGQMSDTTFARIVEGLRAFSPTPTVFFGGLGEPLAHPKIVEMVAQAKALGAHVELITNGTILTENVSRQLIDARLDVLWVSLDGATPESYTDIRLGAALPEVLSNLTTFRKMRGIAHFTSSFVWFPPKPKLGIAFVAMKRNIAELPSVLKLGRQLGAAHFLVSNVLAYTEEMCDEVLYSRALTDSLYVNSLWGAHLEFPKIDVNEVTCEPLYRAVQCCDTLRFAGEDLSKTSDCCPFIDRSVTAISWEGNVSPCLPLLHDHATFLDERERFSRRYVVGNVAEQNLYDLWNMPEYIAFRELVQMFDFSPCIFCGGCDLAEANEEDCFGNPFPTCGGCLWAQGVIRCP